MRGEEGEGGGGERRRSGGERSLHQFLSLRVESSQERAAVYNGEEVVSQQPSMKGWNDFLSSSLRYIAAVVRTREVYTWQSSTRLP